tara:strand:+ start:43 stop:837 length:795 start_codon:yes stop_codon:yes gene_type:complete
MFNQDILKSSLAGSSAGIIQLTSLFWLKTIIKHQYRHGKPPLVSIKLLYRDKDIFRFYRGYSPNLIKSSIGKFGDAAFYTYFHRPEYDYLNPIQRSSYISIASSFLKFNLMPFDTYTNMYQVRGIDARKIMSEKIKKNGIKVLYNGSIAYFLSNFVGNTTWFLTMDYLNDVYYHKHETKNNTIKNLCIGFACSTTSDIITNPIRILKTYKQSNKKTISYKKALKEIIGSKGIINFYLRGLPIKLFMNGINSSIFLVLWKKFENI